MRKKRKTNITDAEDKSIQSGIKQDLDNPEWTAKEFKLAQSASDVLPHIVEAYKQGTLKRRSRGLQSHQRKSLSQSGLIQISPNTTEKRQGMTGKNE